MNPNVPQFEEYWREKISSEIREAMEHSEINAYGAYLIALYGSVDD